MKVAIVDYGAGNLRGVKLGVERAGGLATITSDPRELRDASAIVLPGVGAFGDAMSTLRSLRLDEVIVEEVEAGKPLLGICLGLQLLFDESTEGGLHRGLGLLRGRVTRLPSSVKVPHMGWNTLRLRRRSAIVEGVPDGAYMYFVHSYYASPADEGVVVATTEYGVEFPSVIERPPIYATQFHPEKSGRLGVRLIANFIELARR